MLKKLDQATANTVLAVAALVTSVIAVLVAWDESRVLRQAYRTAFTPVLEVRSGFTFREGAQETNARGQVTARRGEISTYAVTVRNVGPGVARIKSARLTHGAEAATSYAGFMGAMFGPRLSGEATLSVEPTLGYVQVDEERDLIAAEWDTRYPHLANAVSQHLAEAQSEAEAGLGYVVCYCSLFDECWNASVNEPDPEPVRSCEAGDDPSLALLQAYQRGE